MFFSLISGFGKCNFFCQKSEVKWVAFFSHLVTVTLFVGGKVWGVEVAEIWLDWDDPQPHFKRNIKRGEELARLMSLSCT